MKKRYVYFVGFDFCLFGIGVIVPAPPPQRKKKTARLSAATLKQAVFNFPIFNIFR